MKLLISESPIQVIPSLAVALGINEAIIIQQMHYWLNKKRESKDEKSFQQGCYWVFNTYENWQKQFPWMSARTIRRAINNLEESGALLSGNFNKMRIDKTKWYTINYESPVLSGAPCGQNGQFEAAKLDTSTCGQNGHTNNHRLPANYNQETTSSNVSKPKKRFTPPTRNEVLDHMISKGLLFNLAEVESQKFVNHYESKGWLVGKTKMKNWKSAASNWVLRLQGDNKAQGSISKADQLRQRFQNKQQGLL